MEINSEALEALSIADLLAIKEEHYRRWALLEENDSNDAEVQWHIANSANNEYNKRLSNIFIY